MNYTDNIKDYNDCRVFINKENGEVGLALPIFANQTKLFVEDVIDYGLPSTALLGFYEPVGFIIATENAVATLNLSSVEYFDDLGKFNE